MSFTVYKSSAGSGKTYTLVKEYLILVIKEPENYKKILAITFTNKAAAEMKERIIKELQNLSVQPIDENSKTFKIVLPEIISVTGFSQKKVVENAAKVLSLILHNYSDFAIGTIDSFVHRVIRCFAHDLKIPQSFEVEMDIERLISDAVAVLISKAGTNEALTKVLVEFTESRTEEEKSWNIENDIFKFAMLATKENFIQNISLLEQLSISDFLQIQSKLAAIISAYQNQIKSLAKNGNDLIVSLNIPDQAFFQGSRGIVGFFKKVMNNPDEEIVPNSYVYKSIDEDKWTSAKAELSDIAAIDKRKSQIVDCFTSLMNYSEKHFSSFKLYHLIFKNIYPLAVLNEIQKIVEEIKKEEGILPISEFNKKIAAVVLNQPVPFIYERIGERYRTYMIDEFQDTSSLQWRNLLPLIENALSTGNFNMIVGDGKQAIYRWRNGDVEQFAALPDLIVDDGDDLSLERAESLKRNYQEKFLAMNYRSLQEVVKFNNGFFNFLQNQLSGNLSKIYENCSQNYNDRNTGGYVCIDRMEKKQNAEKSFNELVLERVESIILDSFEKKYYPGNIAVLCRSNKNAVLVAKYLLSKNISIVTEESLLIADDPEISFVIAVLRILVGANNDPAALEVLNFLVQQNKIEGHTLDTLLLKFNQGKRKGKSIFDLLGEFGFSLHPAILKSLSLYELAEKLADIFSIEKTINPFFISLLDTIKEYSMKNGSALSSFMEWWDDKGITKSVVLPENNDAVKIMTIHKSKGLEFPVVIYPFANEKVKTSENYAWINSGFERISEMPVALVENSKSLIPTVHAEVYQKELNKSILDLFNVVYVAFTRASEKLFVITQLSEPTETVALSGLITSFLRQNFPDLVSDSRIEFGENIFNKNLKAEADPIEFMKPFRLNSSDNKLFLQQRATESWTPENPEGPVAYGLIAHYVLSQINTIEDLPLVISTLEKSNVVFAGDFQALKAKLLDMIQNPLIAEYFTDRYSFKAEAEIILKSGRAIRPDRIVFKEKSAVILDYKTGKRKPEHLSQLTEYADALKEMGFEIKGKFLLYIDENFVLEL